MSQVAASAAAVAVASPAVAAEQQQQPNTNIPTVYFGVGCFWHIQHEFVEAERTLLGRSDAQLSSRTGYAGGKGIGSEGQVCYHNLRGIADYGKLGHGEVVGMDLPEDKIVDFGKVYFSLFNPRTKGMYQYVLGRLRALLCFFMAFM